MLDTARKHTSLLVTVTAIAVLAASQASAQEGATKPGDGAEQAGPAAGVNADTIDGRHAIGPTTDAKRRAGKLVATNAQGYLPNDIVLKARNADTLDGLDSPVFARSAALGSAAGAVNEADNPVHWRQLKGIPAGFADGADAGITGIEIKYVLSDWKSASPDGWTDTHAPCPEGSIAVGGGGIGYSKLVLTASYAYAYGSAWGVYMHNTDPSSSHGFQAFAVCLSTIPAGGIAFSPARG